MQQVVAVTKTAVVLFLKQYSHQHIPHWGLHTGRAFADWESSFKKGNVMALLQKRKLCRDTLKCLRKRACPSDGLREVFCSNRRKEKVAQPG